MIQELSSASQGKRRSGSSAVLKVQEPSSASQGIRRSGSSAVSIIKLSAYPLLTPDCSSEELGDSDRLGTDAYSLGDVVQNLNLNLPPRLEE